MNKNRKKRAITLLEMMIVIFLIGLIGSVLAYGMRGTLDEGRAFRSKEAIAKVKDLLNLEIGKGADINLVVQNPQPFLENTGMVKNVGKLLKDGWGVPFTIDQENDEIVVRSAKLEQFKIKKREKLGQAGISEVDDPFEDE